MANEEISLKAGAEARVTFKARIDAQAPVALRGWDLRKTAVTVITVARSLDEDGLKARMATFDGPEWSKVCLDELLPIGLALYSVDHDITQASAKRLVLLPEELIQRSGELYGRMLPVAEHNLFDEPKAMEEVNDIRSGTGYLDRSSDLNRLSKLYRKYEAKVKLDGRRYRETDAQDADEVAAEILEAVTNGETPEVRRLKAEAAKILGLAVETYDEVAVIGRVVLRKAGGDVRFGSLRAMSRE